MKIRCPKCQKEIELGVSKFPPMGLEVVCPSCDAKFRMKSKGRAAPSTADAPAVAAAPAPPAPAAPAPAAPAPAAPEPADDFDALDDLADLFDEIEQLSAEEPAAPNYYVRSVSGKTFGPLTVDAIKQMIQTGQLKGHESLSLDEASWRPMIEWDGFEDVAIAPPPPEAAAPAPAAAAPAAAPAAAVVTGAPAPSRAAPGGDGAAPVGRSIDLPPRDQEPPPSAPSTPFQTVDRPSPRRIRSALKDEVLEGGDSGGGIDIKDPKIIGGAVVLVLLLGVVGYLLFSGNGGSRDFTKVSLNLKRPYAIDSHRVYLKQLLPQINRQLRKQPGHPKLLVYKALVLAMYLENHRPDRSRYNIFKRTFRQIKPPAGGETMPFHYLWLLAQRDVLRRKALSVLRLSQAMLKQRANNAAALYLRGKAFALSGRRARAIKTFDMVAQRMGEPARVYYAKGLALAGKKRRRRAKAPAKRAKAPAKRAKAPVKRAKAPAQRAKAPAKRAKAPDRAAPPAARKASAAETEAARKRMEEALQSFYKTYLITKEHYPAYFGVLRYEGKLPEHKLIIKKAWERLTELIPTVPNRQAKAMFYMRRYYRAQRQGDPGQALSWLKKARRFSMGSKKINQLLPKAYLATHDYSMVWDYLKSKMKPLPGKKPVFEPIKSTLLLDVLFRMGKIDTARIWGDRLRRECKRCKKHMEFMFWRGRIAEAKRNYARARILYFAAHKLKPTATAPIAALARIALLSQQNKAANTFLKRLGETQPKSLLDHISMMELAQRQKEHDKVLTLAKPMLKQHPLDPWIHRLAGFAQLGKDNFAQAETHFQTALKVRKKDYQAIEGLGTVYYKQEKYAKALGLFNQVLKPEPDNASVLYRVGRIHFEQKDYKKAERLLKRSIRNYDKAPDAHFYLGRAMEAMKKKKLHEEIKDAYEKAVSLSPDNRTYLYQLASFFYKNQQNRKALAIYTRLLRTPKMTKSQKAEVYLERGKLLFEAQSWSGALRDFRKFTKLSPDDPNGLVWIANVYRDMRRSKQAIRWYKKAIKLLRKNKPSKDDPADAVRWKKYQTTMAMIYGTLGNYYRDSRRGRAAIGYYHRALRFAPKGHMYHRSLGYLYKERRRWASCRRHLKAYLRYAPPKQLIDRQEVLSDIRGCR